VSLASDVSTCPECQATSLPSALQPEVAANSTAVGVSHATSPELGSPSAHPQSAEPHAAGPVLISRDALTVTAVLVGINVLWFVAMVIKGASLTQPNTDQLLRWGANYGPLTLTGQWWRVLTAMFVHIGILHLAVNMWCLWDLGLLAEYLYGPRTFLTVYLMSGLAGSIVSLAHNPLVPTAGASGAIFGIAGALIATLYLGKLAAPRGALRTSLISLIVFAAYSLAYGLLKGGVDNGAHIGGLVSGLVLGSVLSADFHARRSWMVSVRRAIFPAFAVLLLAAAFAVRYSYWPVVRMEHAEQSFRKGDVLGAISELNGVIKARPNYAPAWRLLGTAYLQTGQQDKAEAAFQRAAQINPSNSVALAQLAVLYLRDQRYDQARQLFQKITELNPKDADAQVNLGVTLNLLGHSEEAVVCFRKATTLNPNMPLAWFNYGLGSMNLKHYDDAVQAFSRTTKLAPNDPESWIWLANAYQAKGMTDEADKAYLTGYQLRMKSRRQPGQQRSGAAAR